jgi:hypothetical protein
MANKLTSLVENVVDPKLWPDPKNIKLNQL